MKIKKIKFVLLLFITLAIKSSMQAQVPIFAKANKEDVIKAFVKINDWYNNNPSYSLTVTHYSYENYQTMKEADKSVGYFKKDNSNYHSYLLGIHTIQNEKYRMVIDSVNKIVAVANPVENSENSFMMSDYLAVLNLCSSIKVSEAGREKFYRMEFDENFAYSAYEIAIDGNGLMKEIVLYYNNEVKLGEDKNNPVKTKPRVRITFTNYNQKAQFNYKEDFDDRKYFLKQGEELILNEKYKKFSLSDQRYFLN